MDTQITRAQGIECIKAIGDVMEKGETKRTCPVCGGKLKVQVSKDSGSVQCEVSDCFGKIGIRGI